MRPLPIAIPVVALTEAQVVTQTLPQVEKKHGFRPKLKLSRTLYGLCECLQERVPPVRVRTEGPVSWTGMSSIAASVWRDSPVSTAICSCRVRITPVKHLL